MAPEPPEPECLQTAATNAMKIQTCSSKQRLASAAPHLPHADCVHQTHDGVCRAQHCSSLGGRFAIASPSHYGCTCQRDAQRRASKSRDPAQLQLAPLAYVSAPKVIGSL